MNYKEVKKAYKSYLKDYNTRAVYINNYINCVDLYYEYIAGTTMDAKTRKFIDDNEILEMCKKHIVSILSGTDTLDEKAWQQYIENPKMQNIIEHDKEIKALYEARVKYLKKQKEIIVDRLKRNAHLEGFIPYTYDGKSYACKEFCQLPAYMLDKDLLIAVLPFMQNPTEDLIRRIKKARPEHLEDTEVVAALIKVYDPLGKGDCHYLTDAVFNEVYNRALLKVEDVLLKNRQNKAAEDEAKQKAMEEENRKKEEEERKIQEEYEQARKAEEEQQKEKEDKRRKEEKEEREFREKTAFMFNGNGGALMEVKEKLLNVGSFPYLGAQRFIGRDILTPEELIAILKEFWSYQKFTEGKYPVYIERAYQIYAVVEDFRNGKIKLKDIPTSYFAFDDVVEEVIKIAKEKITEQAIKLTKDLNDTNEVSEKIQEKIGKKIKAVEDEISAKRTEAKEMENSTLDSLDTKIEV